MIEVVRSMRIHKGLLVQPNLRHVVSGSSELFGNLIFASGNNYYLIIS